MSLSAPATACHVPGTPDTEHQRSDAARRTAELAMESALRVAHFEHRAVLPWPEALCPPDMPELAEPPRWQGGQLAEHKFQSFRHDRMTGSFHPGHRAKWTAHELCHSLVGFAYRPGASRYFHALAAWLSELLPVTLYYFLDEAGLRRCPAHAGGGPLFGRYCAACERAALSGPRAWTPEDEQWLAWGHQYLDRELAAYTRARRTGLAHGHRHATLDLCADGVAYARAHQRRLDSEPFERFADSFFAPQQGLHASLDELEARVVATHAALTDGTELPPWHASASDWLAQDLGYRLLMVHSETEGEARSELDRIIEQLAADRTPAGLSRAARDYRALSEQWVLAEPEQLLALGLPFGDEHGTCLTQLEEGLQSACPSTVAALAEPVAQLREFALQDTPARQPLARRFARWLDARQPGPVADLARYEAALTHAAAPDPNTDGLDPARPGEEAVQLSPDVELLGLDYAIADSEAPAQAPRLPTRTWLAIRATPERELSVAELDDALALQLQAGPVEPRTPTDPALLALAELGFVVPCRYSAD